MTETNHTESGDLINPETTIRQSVQFKCLVPDSVRLTAYGLDHAAGDMLDFFQELLLAFQQWIVCRRTILKSRSNENGIICSMNLPDGTPDSTKFSELMSSHQADLGPVVMEDFQKLLSAYDAKETSTTTFRDESQLLLEYCWEKLHSTHWKNVGLHWRVLYASVRLLRSLYTLTFPSTFLFDKKSAELRTCLKDLDYSLLMGYPIFDGIATSLASYVHSQLHEESLSSSKTHETKLQSSNPQSDSVDKPIGLPLNPLQSISRPSLQQFHALMAKGNPFILTEAMTHWPACNKSESRSWTPQYWRRVAGHRLVPVEIGSRYTDDSWGQELITVNDFIDRFIEQSEKSPPNPVGYLAQHQLFLQIPELGEDVFTPDYCAVGCNETTGDSLVDSNVWFGPVNTISPLHHDSDRANLLAQISGSKFVILYTAEETPFLYAHPDQMLFNTSKADVENPDLDQFPLLRKARGFYGVLRAGEMLYIPPRCWHYVRSLSLSFSVNFWWNVSNQFIPPWPESN